MESTCQYIAYTRLAHWVQPSILYLQFTHITCTAYIPSLYKALYYSLLFTHQYTDYSICLSHFILLIWYRSHSSYFLVAVDISSILPLPLPSFSNHCQKRVSTITPIVPATLGSHVHPTTKAKAQSDRTNNPEQNLTKNSHKVFDMRPHMLPKASNYRTRASCTTSSAHVLHVSDIEPSRASMRYTRLRPSTFVHVSVCIINLRQYLALAVEFLLTFDH